MPISILISNFPAFGMTVIMLAIFAVQLKWFPTSGGYGFDLIPSFSWDFIWSGHSLPTAVLDDRVDLDWRAGHWHALHVDLRTERRLRQIQPFLLGLRPEIVGYVFRNAMLPQITGLALSIGTMVGGALVAEIIFSYPGLGSTLLGAVTGRDYPLISWLPSSSL